MSHNYTNLLLHVVFGTKDRRPIVHDSLRVRLFEYMAGFARKEFGGSLAVGGTADHVHGLILLPPTKTVADILRDWKSLSSKWVHETFPTEADFAWQEGYAAFSVSRSNVPKVASYIQSQPEHHKKMTFEEEYIALLKRHEVAFDPQHVWD
jgi:putative transposase